MREREGRGKREREIRERFGSRYDFTGRDRTRRDENERLKREEREGRKDERRENGVSSTAVIRILFVEMVSRLRKPASSLVSPFMILQLGR